MKRSSGIGHRASGIGTRGVCVLAAGGLLTLSACAPIRTYTHEKFNERGEITERFRVVIDDRAGTVVDSGIALKLPDGVELTVGESTRRPDPTLVGAAKQIGMGFVGLGMGVLKVMGVMP